MKRQKDYFRHMIIMFLVVFISFHAFTIPTLAQTMVPVDEIKDVITSMKATETKDLPTRLTATVLPTNATYQNITWSIEDNGNTGAVINGNELSVPVGGTLIVKATIVNGAKDGVNYEQYFPIQVELNDVEKVAYIHDRVEKGLATYLPTNQTTKEEMSQYIESLIAETGYKEVSLDWQKSFDFTKTLATPNQEGLITGQINFICHKAYTSLMIHQTINKLNPTASSEGQIINGYIGEEMGPQTIRIDLKGDTIYQDIAMDSQIISSMIKNLPIGIDVNFKSSLQKGAKFIELTFSGVPTQVNQNEIEMSIPGGILESGQDLVVKTNGPIKWNILKKSNMEQLELCKKEVESQIDLLEVTNETTKEELLAQISHQSLSNQYWKTEIKWKSFDKQPATLLTKGYIKGELELALGNESLHILIQKDIEILKKYVFKEGENSVWKPETENLLEIRVDGEIEKFTGIMINGKEIDKSFYSVRSGSTIITFKENYLNTLGYGQFELIVKYTDGHAKTYFTIETNEKKAQEEKIEKALRKEKVTSIKEDTKKRITIPQTKDVNEGMYYFGLLTVTTLFFVCSIKTNRKLKNR